MGIFHKKNEDGVKEPTAFTNGLAKTFASTSKQLVWFYSINGVAWIWCSYALAFMDRVQIAETLSSNVCTIVIGQIGFYLVTKTIENVFKYNDIFKARDKQSNDEIKEDTSDVEFSIPIPQPISVPDDISAIEPESDDEPVG